MKKGLTAGLSQSLEVEITEEMFAHFHGEVVHPVYSTAAMVYHMECVSRDLLLPYLEEQEESAGAAVTVNHIFPSAYGSKVVHVATLSEITPRRVTATVIARNENGIIGEGEVTQAILPKHSMQRKLEKQKI